MAEKKKSISKKEKCADAEKVLNRLKESEEKTRLKVKELTEKVLPMYAQMQDLTEKILAFDSQVRSNESIFERIRQRFNISLHNEISAAAGDAFGAEGARGIFRTGRVKRAKAKIAENRALKEKYSGQRRGGKSLLGAKLTEFFSKQSSVRGKKGKRRGPREYKRSK